ncbi:MAG: hypothetical protein WC758_06615 [Candidatus Woesearchaeota archaeon]|jgi:hypothetical protein
MNATRKMFIPQIYRGTDKAIIDEFTYKSSNLQIIVKLAKKEYIRPGDLFPTHPYFVIISTSAHSNRVETVNSPFKTEEEAKKEFKKIHDALANNNYSIEPYFSKSNISFRVGQPDSTEKIASSNLETLTKILESEQPHMPDVSDREFRDYMHAINEKISKQYVNTPCHNCATSLDQQTKITIFKSAPYHLDCLINPEFIATNNLTENDLRYIKRIDRVLGETKPSTKTPTFFL